MSHQDQGVTLSIKEHRQVQGRRGSNPIKAKKEIKTPSLGIKGKPSRTQEEKPAWVVESCLTRKGRASTTNNPHVKTKECCKEPTRTSIQGTTPNERNAKTKKTVLKPRFVKGRKGYPKAKDGRYTLDWYKCHLDSCASYHTFFTKAFLRKISKEA